MAIWALSCFPPNVAMFAFGVIGGARLFWLWSLWPLVDTVLATLAGAWVYREGRSVAVAGSAVRA